MSNDYGKNAGGISSEIYEIGRSFIRLEVKTVKPRFYILHTYLSDTDPSDIVAQKRLIRIVAHVADF